MTRSLYLGSVSAAAVLLGVKAATAAHHFFKPAGMRLLDRHVHRIGDLDWTGLTAAEWRLLIGINEIALAVVASVDTSEADLINPRSPYLRRKLRAQQRVYHVEPKPRTGTITDRVAARRARSVGVVT